MMSALISKDNKYRYWLTRDFERSILEAKPPTFFVMLNPSTADADKDDATIRRCISFAKSWGSSEMIVCNLYAYRATDPKQLWEAEDPIGAENDDWLEQMARAAGDTVVCARGANARQDRVAKICMLMGRLGVEMWCLGTTNTGAPKHPLYVKGDRPLTRWPK